jgi:outer membrane protein, heavy metal efflux system
VRALRLGAVTWLVVLAGCANVSPPGRPTPERPPVMGASSVVMPLSPPAPQEAPAPGPPGARLERLSLADALARAERLHPELAASRAQIERAEGLALQAGLFPNPELVARIESATLTAHLTEQAEYVVGVSQAIPLGPRLARARQAELLDRDRLTYALAAKRLDIRMQVQSAFATALYWQRVVQAREEDVRSAANGVALAQARLAAGDTIPAEVAQAEMELRRAELERDNATSSAAQALDVLGMTLGDATLQVASLDGTLEETLTVPALASLAARLEENPFLAAATAEIAVQRAQLDVVQAQRTPDVNLDLFYRRLGDRDNAFDMGVRLPLHVFDRGQGRLQATRAELAAAEARARTVRNEQSLRLQTAHRKLARAVAAATLLRRELLPRAERVLQSAETRYRAGDMSLTELVPLRREWTRVRVEYLDALHEVMQAWAELSPYLW